MNAAGFRNKSQAELIRALEDLVREQANLRMQKSTGQLNKSDQIKKVRRNIARIYTILRQQNNTPA